MTAHYAPGDGALLAVRDGVSVLVLDASAPSALTPASLWDALALDEPVTHVLEVLSSAGLAAMPAFAIVDARGGAARAFVRGALTIAVESSGAQDALDGADVSTWRESVIPSFDVIRISPSGGDSAGESLPLEAGVVRAAAVELRAAAVELRSGAAPHARTTPTAVTPLPPPPAPSPAPSPVESAPVAEQTLTEPFDADPPAPDEGLFEETLVRTPAEAALIGDHDGLTVVGRDIPGFAERERVIPPSAAPPPAPAPGYVIEVDSGLIEPLAGPVIVGRAPTASKVSSGAVPRLVVISDNPDISRTHVRIALEGDTVVVTDLHSRNGTTVRMPGKPPQLLRAGEATPVLDGTVIDLGGTTLAVRSR
ncbi:MAG: FHA domain-containing protein [Microcella sp.]|uniref:FHA domain-containing protein n=1 Tax=Microcella sp. TaxID=1913979 RepID=UPI0027179554|nr:FHA domain-containing protein [Microcella sp.]MDO8337381.1 FHA domain-containing protein [Microcella sp.]